MHIYIHKYIHNFIHTCIRTRILPVCALTSAPLRKYNIYTHPHSSRFHGKYVNEVHFAATAREVSTVTTQMGVPGLPRSKGTSALVSRKLYCWICPYLPGQCAFREMFYIREKFIIFLRDGYGLCQCEYFRTTCILEYSHVRLETHYE